MCVCWGRALGEWSLLGIKARVLGMLGKYFTTELQLQLPSTGDVFVQGKQDEAPLMLSDIMNYVVLMCTLFI